jgi:hypothetical protein
LTYRRLNEALIEAVPELRVPYEAERRLWRDAQPGPHVVYADILGRFLVAELESGARKKLLRRIFAFLEDLAMHPDVQVQEVVQQEVCADLCGYQPWGARRDKYIQPRTLTLMQEYCDHYHRPH